jgi:hypothetical protein
MCVTPVTAWTQTLLSETSVILLDAPRQMTGQYIARRMVSSGMLRPDEGGAKFLRNVGSYKSHIPKDAILHSHCRENLKSYTVHCDVQYPLPPAFPVILALDLTYKIKQKNKLRVFWSESELYRLSDLHW